uniref:Integrase catalytic domain-containing protein n=2 Tax=Nicotiana TaxID=4085 RepID=A0A1S3Z8L8_TOBAC|nr:PREDICTED: uncharacterized protein LOC104244565 [Nicotiana sylvestris]XP_016460825.1 PREDICTED: uncharacterized protein LOC107784245 [Nicotiana tabacum]
MAINEQPTVVPPVILPANSNQGGLHAIDYNHPLFLSPSDVSGIQIISFQLTGIENYSLRFRSMRMALLGRNKLVLVDGTFTKENFPENLWNHWERVNAIVLSWLMNSVSNGLLGSIMYASSAKAVRGMICMKEFWSNGKYTLDGNCTFTKEQYDHIVQLLNKDNLSVAIPSANVASTTATPSANAVGIPCALLASNNLQEWIIDIGATNHMVADIELLNKVSLMQTNQLKKVHLPNGETTQVTHIGTSTLTDQDIITNELFSGRVKAIGKEDSGLYILSRQKLPRNNAISLNTKETEISKETNSNDIELWHRRLGYVSATIFKKLFSTNAQDISAKIDLCTTCPCAKQTRKPFPISSIKIATSFELVHMDVWDPYKIPTMDVRTDNGTEFVNSVCENFFKNIGAIHQKTSPCTPQQNGVAERKHRHILELTRAIRFQANIPIKFWAASNISEPTLYSEAVKDPKWIDAMKAEIEALQNNHTWDIVTLPTGKIPIGCKWIYKIKYKASGEIERFKARLVAKCFSQKEG